MGNSENQPVETAPQLSSSRLHCLQLMGITVWQRRGVSSVGPAPDLQAAEASPGAAHAPEDNAAQQTAVASQNSRLKNRQTRLLDMQVNKAVADTAVTQASVVIVRAALAAPAAETLDTDEYQLLLKMMASINLSANEWICASECSVDDSAIPVALRQVLDTATAEVLLLLLPARELAQWEQHWVDFETDGKPAADWQWKKISVAGRVVSVAPLCDPRDLLLDGALKRDAWECLKQVRATLSLLSIQVPNAGQPVSG